MVMAEVARPPDGSRRNGGAAHQVYLVTIGDGRLAESVAARLRSGLAEAGLAGSVLVSPIRGTEFFTVTGHRRVVQWWSAQQLEGDLESAVLVAKDDEELAGIAQRAYVVVRPGKLAGRAGQYGPSVVEIPAAKVSELARSVVAHERSLRTVQAEPSVAPVERVGEPAHRPVRQFSLLPTLASAARVFVGQRRRVSTVMLAGALGIGGWVLSAAVQPGEAAADPGRGVQGAHVQPQPKLGGEGGEIPHRRVNVSQEQREALQRLRDIGRKLDQGRMPGQQGHRDGSRPAGDRVDRPPPRDPPIRQRQPNAVPPREPEQPRQVAQERREPEHVAQRQQVDRPHRNVRAGLPDERQAPPAADKQVRVGVPEREVEIPVRKDDLSRVKANLPSQLAERLGVPSIGEQPKAQLPMKIEGGGTKVHPIQPNGIDRVGPEALPGDRTEQPQTLPVRPPGVGPNEWGNQSGKAAQGNMGLGGLLSQLNTLGGTDARGRSGLGNAGLPGMLGSPSGLMPNGASPMGGAPGPTPVTAQTPGYVDPLAGITQPPPVKLYEPPDYSWEYPNGKSQRPSEANRPMVPDINKQIRNQIVTAVELGLDVADGAAQGFLKGYNEGRSILGMPGTDRLPGWIRKIPKPGLGIAEGIHGGYQRLKKDTDNFSRPFDPQRSTLRDPNNEPFGIPNWLLDNPFAKEPVLPQESWPTSPGTPAQPPLPGTADEPSSGLDEGTVSVTPAPQPIAAPEPAPAPQPQPAIPPMPETPPYVDPVPPPTQMPPPVQPYEPPVYQTTPQSTGSGGGWTGPGAVPPDSPTPPPGSQYQVDNGGGGAPAGPVAGDPAAYPGAEA